MSIEEKVAKIIDLNLFSGSADHFRTAVGGYFEIVDINTTEDTTITTGQEIQQEEPNMDSVYTQVMIPESPFFDAMFTTGDSTTNSTEVIIPNYRATIKTYAEIETWKDDGFWKTYWMGGSHAGITYPSLYSETVWDDYWFEFAFPYSQMEANSLVDKENVTNIAEITCNYNYYLPEYQNYVNNLESELLIPNMYLIEMFNAQTIGDSANPEGLMSESEDAGTKVFNQTI